MPLSERLCLPLHVVLNKYEHDEHNKYSKIYLHLANART